MGYRGGYYAWFLQSMHALDSLTSAGDANDLQHFRNAMFRSVDERLNAEDRKIGFSQFPKAKRLCYMLYCAITHGWRPSSYHPTWFHFGFCACSNEQAAGKLARLYQALVGPDSSFKYFHGGYLFEEPRCTFYEFLEAYEKDAIIELIDSKGLKSLRTSLQLTHLESFLSNSGMRGWPVWLLKTYIASDFQALSTSEWSEMMDEYGLAQCDTAMKRRELGIIFKKVLHEADPTDMHEACLAGRLSEFCSRFVTLPPHFKRFLKNSSGSKP